MSLKRREYYIIPYPWRYNKRSCPDELRLIHTCCAARNLVATGSITNAMNSNRELAKVSPGTFYQNDTLSTSLGHKRISRKVSFIIISLLPLIFDPSFLSPHRSGSSQMNPPNTLTAISSTQQNLHHNVCHPCPQPP